MIRIALASLLVVLAVDAPAQTSREDLPAVGVLGPLRVPEIVEVRYGEHEDYDRIVFELDAPAVVVRRSVEPGAEEVFEIEARPQVPHETLESDLLRLGRVSISETIDGAEVRISARPRRVRAYLLHDPERLVIDLTDPGPGPFGTPAWGDGILLSEVAAPDAEPPPAAPAPHPIEPASDGSPGDEPAPTPPSPDAPRGDSLSLRQAVRLALENNLDIQLARYEPAIAAQGVGQARGLFDPQVSASGRFEHTESPSVSVLEEFFRTGRAIASFNVTNENRWTYAGGVGGILPVGVEYSSSFSHIRTDSDFPTAGLVPEFRAIWANQLTLPLLRDLFDNEASIAIRRSHVARDVSIQAFRQQLTDLIVAVETAYWELAAARAEDRVARKSLHTAQDLLEQTRVQYQVGVVSRVAVSQAEAGVAEREVGAIQAKNRRETAHDQLLNILLAPETRVFSEHQVIPEDPTYTDYAIDERVAVEKAMALRPELAQARKGLEDADLQLALAENQLLPSLDLRGSYQLDGLAGTHNPTGIGKRAQHALDDFFRDSGAHSWTTGLQFSIPFPNTSARSRRLQGRIELRRARTRLRRLEQLIILEIRSAARSYRSSVEGYEAAQRRRTAQDETLAAEQERLRLGDSTPFQVLEFEEDLAAAERQVIVTLQFHRNSISALERAQATLLERHGIEIEQELSR